MNIYRLRTQRGLSLIELMLSITLGMLLLIGLLSLFLQNRETYNVQDGLTRMQENARFTNFFLNSDIRMAGYQGCMSSNTAVTLVNPVSTIQFNDDTVVQGFEATGSSSWTPALPTSVSGLVRDGTDALQIISLDPNSVPLSNSMASASAILEVPTRINFATNDIVMISDCENTDIFRATAVGTSPMTIAHAASGNISANLSKAYQTDARVSLVNRYIYFIGDSGRTNEAGNTIFSLFRQDINGNNEELVEGVENLQINYGLDTTGDGNADTFQGASSVDGGNNWPQVVSVGVAQLYNTVEDVNNRPQAYTFNGTTVSSPGDNMLRRQWDSFITVRNRTF